ncbi:MAG: YicC/YloC family endoribonuclease [Christensenellaceae bacterium]
MLSMTGYGKGEYKDGGIELTCEIKTVNNRYLDVSVKAPRIFAAYEDMVRSLVREKLTRGHADVFVSCKDKREKPAALTADVGLAASYVAAAQALKEAFPSLADDVTLSSVLRYPDVLKQDDAAAADEALTGALKAALNAALDNLNRRGLRRGEAEGGYARPHGHDRGPRERIASARRWWRRNREKLKARIAEYLGGAGIDEGKFSPRRCSPTRATSTRS